MKGETLLVTKNKEQEEHIVKIKIEEIVIHDFFYKQLRILVSTRVAYFSANSYISCCLMIA